MIRLLQLLFLGHIHKWKETGRTTLTLSGAYDGKGNWDLNRVIANGTRVELKCETCGDVTKRDLI